MLITILMSDFIFNFFNKPIKFVLTMLHPRLNNEYYNYDLMSPVLIIDI